MSIKNIHTYRKQSRKQSRKQFTKQSRKQSRKQFTKQSRKQFTKQSRKQFTKQSRKQFTKQSRKQFTKQSRKQSNIKLQYGGSNNDAPSKISSLTQDNTEKLNLFYLSRLDSSEVVVLNKFDIEILLLFIWVNANNDKVKNDALVLLQSLDKLPKDMNTNTFAETFKFFTEVNKDYKDYRLSNTGELYASSLIDWLKNENSKNLSILFDENILAQILLYLSVNINIDYTNAEILEYLRSIITKPTRENRRRRRRLPPIPSARSSTATLELQAKPPLHKAPPPRSSAQAAAADAALARQAAQPLLPRTRPRPSYREAAAHNNLQHRAEPSRPRPRPPPRPSYREAAAHNNLPRRAAAAHHNLPYRAAAPPRPRQSHREPQCADYSIDYSKIVDRYTTFNFSEIYRWDANSCYYHSALRLLQNIREFINFLLTKDENSKFKQLLLKELIERTGYPTKDTIEIVKRVLPGKENVWGNSNDASEFLLNLLNLLNTPYTENISNMPFLTFINNDDENKFMLKLRLFYYNNDELVYNLNYRNVDELIKFNEKVNERNIIIFENTQYFIINIEIWSADSQGLLNLNIENINDYVCVGLGEVSVLYELISIIAYKSKGKHFINYSKKFVLDLNEVKWIIFDDLYPTKIIANDNELHIDPKFIPYILLYKKI
jgi:hypothetical protein